MELSNFGIFTYLLHIIITLKGLQIKTYNSQRMNNKRLFL